MSVPEGNKCKFFGKDDTLVQIIKKDSIQFTQKRIRKRNAQSYKKQV